MNFEQFQLASITSPPNIQAMSQTIECPKCGTIVPKQTRYRDKLDEYAKLDWSLTCRALAAATGKPYSSLCYYRRKLGIPKGKLGRNQMRQDAKQRKLHEPLDFTKTDSELGVIHGVTRERIRQLRKDAGLPSSLTLHRDPEWTAKADWSKNNKIIASIFKVSQSSVAGYRHKLGIPQAARHNAKYAWGTVDWSLRNKVIAEQLKAPYGTVAMRRSMLRRCMLKRLGQI